MKNLLLTLVAAFLAASVPGAELRVVTTIPDLADITREIGGDRVRVYSLSKGTMNIHSVPLRPSALVQVSKADLFVQMGFSLEHAFVPGLLMGARNDRIQPGMPGFVNCSLGWEAIDVPAEADRRMSADNHPEGNPHFNLDPRAGLHIARHIRDALVRVDPDGTKYYEARFTSYSERLEKARQRWDVLAESLSGKQIVLYHHDFDYFARSRGLVVVGTIEAKPGVPPSPRDLANTITLMKRKGVSLIVTAKWSNNKNVRFVAEKTGARVLEVPVLVGGTKGAGSWIAMMDYLHEQLSKALITD